MRKPIIVALAHLALMAVVVAIASGVVAAWEPAKAIEPDTTLGERVYYNTIAGATLACTIGRVVDAELQYMDLSCIRQPPTKEALPKLNVAFGCGPAQWRWPVTPCN